MNWRFAAEYNETGIAELYFVKIEWLENLKLEIQILE